MTFEEWMNNEDKKRTCTYNVNLALVTSIEEAIFIRRLFYLWGKFKNENQNGIFMIGIDFWASSGIKDFTFRKIIKKWEEGGLLQIRKFGSPPTNYYCLDEKRIEQYLNELAKIGSILYNLCQEKRKERKRKTQEETDILNRKINFCLTEIKDWYEEIKDWYAKIDFCIQGYIYNNIIQFFNTIVENHKDDSLSSSPPEIDEASPEKKKKIYDIESEEYVLAEYLMNRIKKNFPRHEKKWPSSVREKILQKWARQIDLMIRIDKHDSEEILDIIDWCQDDKFWKSNILSAGKLREQFFDLSARIDNQKDNGSTLQDPDLTLTQQIIDMFTKLIDCPDEYTITPSRRNKFIQTTEKMLKFFERGKNPTTGEYRIPKIAWIGYLRDCMVENYRNKGETIFPGHLCARNTWDTLMPQHLQELGIWYRKEN